LLDAAKALGIGEKKYSHFQYLLKKSHQKLVKKVETLSNTILSSVNGKIEGAIGINAHNELWYANASDVC